MNRAAALLVVLATCASAQAGEVVQSSAYATGFELRCAEGERPVGRHAVFGPYCAAPDGSRIRTTYGGDWGVRHERARRAAHVAVVADYLTTKHGLRRGGREANPIVRAITPEGALAVSVLVNEYLHRQLATRSLVAVAVVRGGIAINNIRVTR